MKVINDLNNLFDTLTSEIAKIDRFHEFDLHAIEDMIVNKDFSWDLNHNDVLFN